MLLPGAIAAHRLSKKLEIATDMKSLKIAGYLLGTVLLGVGVAAAVTNPNQSAYEDYATARLTTYLQDNACTQAPSVLGNLLGDQCADLLENNQDEIRKFISSNTDRQNWVILSVYKTDLAIADGILPSYHFETVGVFQQFFTYKADRQ
jgi:Domain of unknown function (DUF4359)